MFFFFFFFFFFGGGVEALEHVRGEGWTGVREWFGQYENFCFFIWLKKRTSKPSTNLSSVFCLSSLKYTKTLQCDNFDYLFPREAVPRDVYTLFHYRSCKPSWKDCKTRPRLEDRSMLQYELPLVQRILSLPNLDRLLYNNTEYVKHLRRWFSEKQ